jgi:hypothetical protein
MSLEEVRRLPPKDFSRCRLYINLKYEESFERHSSLEWQLAGISYQIYLLRHQLAYLFTKSPPSPEGKLKDFMVNVKFEDKKKEESADGEDWDLGAYGEEIAAEPEFKLPVYEGMSDSEQFWLAAVKYATPKEE